METPPDKNNDQSSKLWDSFLEGDDRAFESLFNLFSDPLYRYGMKFVPNDDAVKDCVQDVFIRVYNNRGKLPANINPKLYLFRSLKNRLIDEIRSSKHLEYVSSQELNFHVEYYYDPEDEKEQDAEIKDQFEKAMSLLTDRQKEALYLRFQMEMSYQEIAQLLDINYQSVRNLTHRAIEKIRSEMSLPLFILMLIKHV